MLVIVHSSKGIFTPLIVNPHHLSSAACGSDKKKTNPVVPPRRCDVHDEALVPAEAQIVYGIWIGDDLEETRRRLFPHARSRIDGGCFYGAELPKKQPVMACPACRTAELEWQMFFKAP